MKYKPSRLDPENRTLWDDLLTMESHRVLRNNQPNSVTTDRKIVDNFLRWREQGAEIPFEEDEIYTVSGIIDVNAHVFPVKTNGNILTYVCCATN